MVLNSAHDSICACSIDEVVDAVAVRFAEARQIGEGLTRRAVQALSASLDATGSAVVNPSARVGNGVVALITDGHDDITGTQVLHRRGGDHRSVGLTVADVATLAPTAVNNMPELYVASPEIATDGTVELTRYADTGHSGPPFMPAEVTELLRMAEENPATPAVFTVKLPPSQKVLAFLPEAPGFGWTVWNRDAAPGLPANVRPAAVHDTGSPHGGVHIGNGLLEIDIDHTTRTFTLDDTYNYNPPTLDRLIDQPESVAVRVLEQGPLRVRVAVDCNYLLPARAAKGERVGEVPTLITSTIEGQAGSSLVWVVAGMGHHGNSTTRAPITAYERGFPSLTRPTNPTPSAPLPWCPACSMPKAARRSGPVTPALGESPPCASTNRKTMLEVFGFRRGIGGGETVNPCPILPRHPLISSPLPSSPLPSSPSPSSPNRSTPGGVSPSTPWPAKPERPPTPRRYNWRDG